MNRYSLPLTLVLAASLACALTGARADTLGLNWVGSGSSITDAGGAFGAPLENWSNLAGAGGSQSLPVGAGALAVAWSSTGTWYASAGFPGFAAGEQQVLYGNLYANGTPMTVTISGMDSIASGAYTLRVMASSDSLDLFQPVVVNGTTNAFGSTATNGSSSAALTGPIPLAGDRFTFTLAPDNYPATPRVRGFLAGLTLAFTPVTDTPFAERITGIQVDSSTAQLALTWTSLSNTLYTIETLDDFTRAHWRPVVTNILSPGTNLAANCPLPNTNAQAFLRVRREVAETRYRQALDSAAVLQGTLASLTENCLILGNGDLNGLLYAGSSSLLLRLTKNDVWDARNDTSQDPALMQVNVTNHTWSGGANGVTPSYNLPYPCPLTCAIVSIGPSQETNSLMASTLDLRRAVARVAGNKTVPSATLRALAQQNVFLIESAALVSLLSSTATFVPAPTRGTNSGVEYLLEQVPADPGYPTNGDWPGMTYVVAKAVQGARTAVAVVTSLESSNVLADAVALAQSTLAADTNALVQAHESLWNRFWSASRVAVGDAFLQSVWYRNLYFMRCVSKPGGAPVGLYAGLVNDTPNWHGFYCCNYNTEQTHWAWYACNHAELSEPYERLFLEQLPRGKWFAQQTYGCNGAFWHYDPALHEPPDPAACKSKNGRQMAFNPWSYTLGVAGWIVQNHWLHYKYYPDAGLLATNTYPVLKEVATFYADLADKCRADTNDPGRVVLGPSFSPEHWSFGRDNGTCDIAFGRLALKAAIEGATTLGVDTALVARWQATLAKFPDYPRSADNPPVIVDVAGAPPTTYNVAVPALPVFPAGEIHWFSPAADKDIFTRTMTNLSWNGYNSSIILSVARARLSLTNTWSWVKGQLQARSRPNGTLTLAQGDLNGNFTEQFAAAGAVVELLLQSVNDIIRVFPAWPASLDAAFEGLRAQGGFLMSATQSSRQIQSVTVNSTAGGTLRFLNPWAVVPLAQRNGVAVALTNEGNGICSLSTAAGDVVNLTPQP